MIDSKYDNPYQKAKRILCRFIGAHLFACWEMEEYSLADRLMKVNG